MWRIGDCPEGPLWGSEDDVWSFPFEDRRMMFGVDKRINVSYQGLISGFKCSGFGPSITHLLFANYSLLFSKADTKDCKEIRKLLDTYAAASGQVVNYSKSEMCISLMVRKYESVRLASILGVRVVECDDRYNT
ncbi:hypothetical protein Dsin_005092 [Dipteronia sinensis]|uniref:Reverse transcriptase n=1 Tax=Dipteronia sinensis TaxID=43782 RepID=A0AAE0AWR4_9ROSI|nr:hypothetical protein Dsin_005092 [Dipteronia sinensis]